MLQTLRRAIVAPEREPLSGEVEVDETLVGGHHEGRRGGRQRDGKALVGVVVEVRGPGSGRLRLQVLPDASQATLSGWVETLVARGAIVHTDGWKGYDKLAADYDHRPLLQRRDHPDEQKLLPRPPGDAQPQDLAPEHPPRCLARAPAGLSGRVRLPPQPPAHTDGRLPDAARAGNAPPSDDLPRDHPTTAPAAA